MPLWITAGHQSGIILKNPGVKRKDRRDPHAGAWKDEPYNYAMGEEALWRAVITQAMMDATLRTRKPELVVEKIQAIKWLCGDSDDFTDVCERAGLNANRVRVRAKRALANPSAWRIEAGESERYEYRKELRMQKRYARAVERIEQIPPLSGCIIFTLHA